MGIENPQIPELTPGSIKSESVLRRVTEVLRGSWLIAGWGIKVSRLGWGATISVDEAILGLDNGGSSAATYAGPFAVTVKDSNEVSIAAGSVYNGYTKTDYAGADLTTSGTGTFYVYIKETYSGGFVVVGYGSTTRATQSAGNYYHPIASVTVASAVPSDPVQFQFGDIIVAGRYA